MFTHHRTCNKSSRGFQNVSYATKTVDSYLFFFAVCMGWQTNVKKQKKETTKQNKKHGMFDIGFLSPLSLSLFNSLNVLDTCVWKVVRMGVLFICLFGCFFPMMCLCFAVVSMWIENVSLFTKQCIKQRFISSFFRSFQN